MAFNHKHLIDITEYSEEDIKLILETAKAFSEVNERAIKKVPTLKGKTIVNMFNEPSTRTRSSFELAEKRLSADSLNFDGVGLAAHDLKGGDQRAADAGVRDIADDSDLQTVEVTLVLPDGVQVEQGLRGMVVLAVTGADDARGRVLRDDVGSAGVLIR